MFGGQTVYGTFASDTWRWTGTNWQQLSPATVPPGRFDATIAFDAKLGRLLLFGGHGNSGRLDDTWTWTGTTWEQLFPEHSPPGWRGDGL